MTSSLLWWECCTNTPMQCSDHHSCHSQSLGSHSPHIFWKADSYGIASGIFWVQHVFLVMVRGLVLALTVRSIECLHWIMTMLLAIQEPYSVFVPEIKVDATCCVCTDLQIGLSTSCTSLGFSRSNLSAFQLFCSRMLDLCASRARHT